MNEYISFVSTQKEWDMTVILLTALAVLSLILILYNLVKPGHSTAEKLRSPFNLTLIAAFVLTSSMAIYTWANTSNLDEVIITDTSIITPFGTCRFDNIKEASFIKLQNSDSITFLLIEEYNGSVHPLSEKNYDVHAILRELKANLADQMK